ncbi:uncharacterized protein LOC143617148 [Bidens hawaiensis]|uniref:uncharacterized protein LOC143617148 n=1 Tax=Bidens hawaiensis TaxID=980011 RepID=UPI00404A3188
MLRFKFGFFLTEIGLGLTGFGIFFSFLGIVFFFDKGLLAIGNVRIIFQFSFIFIIYGFSSNTVMSINNHFIVIMNQILFVSGVLMTIGIKASMKFFMKQTNLKVSHTFLTSDMCLCSCGTISFGIGFFFVTSGWPVIGMAIEAYGFVILFRLVKCVTHETFTYIIHTYIWLNFISLVVSGPRYRFLCRRYQLSVGCFNSLLLDWYVNDYKWLNSVFLYLSSGLTFF